MVLTRLNAFSCCVLTLGIIFGITNWHVLKDDGPAVLTTVGPVAHPLSAFSLQIHQNGKRMDSQICNVMASIREPVDNVVVGLNKKNPFFFSPHFPPFFPLLLHFSACAHKKIVFSL